MPPERGIEGGIVMLQTLGRILISVAALTVASPFAGAQTSAGDPDAQRKADLVTAYKILVNEGILDSFGHVTVRSSKDPNIIMPRAMPPAIVSPDDIMEM